MADVIKNQTIHQMQKKNGDPYLAQGTHPITVAYSQVFSHPLPVDVRKEVKPLMSGEEYYQELIPAIINASESIMITGLQVNWDTQLNAEGMTLYDALSRALAKNKNLKIYVMPWSSLVTPGHDRDADDGYDVLYRSSSNFSKEAKIILEDLNNFFDKEGKPLQTEHQYKVLNSFGGVEIKTQEPRIFVFRCPGFPDVDTPLIKYSYTHHQKFIVIDSRVVFVGSIDVMFGRFDDNTYKLQADDKKREGMNRYNTCIPDDLKIQSESNTNAAFRCFHEMKVNNGNSRSDAEIYNRQLKELQDLIDTNSFFKGYQDRKFCQGQVDPFELRLIKNIINYYKDKVDVQWFEKRLYNIRETLYKGGAIQVGSTLDPSKQPRLPWQDLQHKITNEGIINVMKLNFALRWNIGCEDNHHPKIKLPTVDYPNQIGKTQGTVQVLRSASENLRKKETEKLENGERLIAFTHLGKNAEINIEGPQNDNHQAMINLIQGSQHYIYIENQYFTSCYGIPNPSFDSPLSGPAQSKSGLNQDGKQWTTELFSCETPENAIVGALAGRVCQAISDKHKPPFHVYIVMPVHNEAPLNDSSTMEMVHLTVQTLFFGIGSLLRQVKIAIEEANNLYKDNRKWQDYLTFLNLRNWAILGSNETSRLVTEQIYPHTKLMIVDDRFVLHGSANINDRSLLGKRDSEVGVLIIDGEDGNAPLCGEDGLSVRPYARDLRIKIWKKLLGYGIDGRSAEGKVTEAMLQKPASKETVEAIQDLALTNLIKYQQVFDWIPGKDRSTSIWPAWDISEKKLHEKIAKKSREISLEAQKYHWDHIDKRNQIILEENQILNEFKKERRYMPFEKEFWTVPPNQTILGTVEGGAATLAGVKGFIVTFTETWTQGENNHTGIPALACG